MDPEFVSAFMQSMEAQTESLSYDVNGLEIQGWYFWNVAKLKAVWMLNFEMEAQILNSTTMI